MKKLNNLITAFLVTLFVTPLVAQAQFSLTKQLGSFIIVGTVPGNGKTPIPYHFPVPKVREPNINDPSDYYFPIGWSVFLHDFRQGVPLYEYNKDHYCPNVEKKKCSKVL